MALTCTNFTCFAEVEAAYNSITPYRGRLSAFDVRPLGDRRRHWDRIQKVNADCYALHDGDCGVEATPEQAVLLAPIVWFRHPDGSESVKLRNATGRGAHNARYSFLARHTPSRLVFRNVNGKQYITNWNQPGTDIFLAKGRTILEGRHARSDSYFTYEDDGVALTFDAAKPAGGWVFRDNGKPIPVAPRRVVDRAEKGKYKQAIKEFREWAFIMLPMIPIDDYRYRIRMHKEFLSVIPRGVFDGVAFEPSELERNQYSHYHNKPSVVALRRILEDNNHPLRLHMLVYCLAKLEYPEEYKESVEGAVRIKTAFTRIMNRVFGFNTEV